MGLVVTLTCQLSSRFLTWHWRPCNAPNPPKQLQLLLSICFVGRYTTWMLALTIVLGPATLPPTRLTICWVQVRSPRPRKTSSTEAEVCKVRETLKWFLGGAGELQFAFQAACDGAVVPHSLLRMFSFLGSGCALSQAHPVRLQIAWGRSLSESHSHAAHSAAIPRI